MKVLILDPRLGIKNITLADCEAIYIKNSEILDDTYVPFLLTYYPQLMSENIPVYLSGKTHLRLRLFCKVLPYCTLQEMVEHFWKTKEQGKIYLNERFFFDDEEINRNCG